MLSMDEIRNLKVADLKNELKQRNLSIAGKKAELVSRLEAFLKEAKDGEEGIAGKDRNDDETPGNRQDEDDGSLQPSSSNIDTRKVAKEYNESGRADMVPSSSPLARDDGLGSLKGQQGKVPLHLDNNLDQDFSSSEIFQESLVQFAHDTWAFGRAEASISLQYDAKVVEHVYQHELGGGQRDPPARSLALLELSMYLEKYLWPFYKPKSMGPSYFMSIMLMVNEKAREGSPTWTCFHGRKDDFPSFLAEALSLPMSFKLTYIERITFLNFVSNAFQSLEDTMVCGEVLRLVGLPLWHALSPGRLQLELHEHPTLVKHWKSLLKREAKLQGEPKEGQWLKLCQKHLGANFLPVLLTEFLTVLETEDVLSSETTRKYCEFFVSFLSTLLSQLPTRRFLHAVLDDQAVWIRCHGSQLYGHPSGKNFVKLVDKMQSLLIFPIDDHTGDAINDDVGVSLHHERVLRLQRLMYKYWPQLREASLVNCGQLARGNVLKKYLLSLAEKDLFRLVVKQLRLVSEDVANNKDSDFLVNVMLVAFERHKSQKEVIQSMPLYPTEKILLDDEAIPPDGIQTALTSGILALPTLNLQFLSMMDYLVRNFLLFQLESAFEIREDIADAVRRTSPYVGDDGAINYSGWSRMALQINSFSIREVKQPRIGETCPASVTADLVIDTHSLRADIAAEWDQLKEHDVLFFLRFDVQNLSNRTTVDWKGPKGRALHSSGLQYVRGAEIIEIRDADGKLMNDYSGRIPVDEVGQPSGTLRTITISLDPVQYHRDLLERGPDNLRRLYSGFDLVVRRHARENNFKSVLESIRDLVTDEESVEAVPSWLHDVLLGYGDPKDANFDLMDGEERPNSIDFKDTFMDLDHLKESFPMYDVVCSQSEDTQYDAVRPYFRISAPHSDTASKEGISSKKRKLGDEVIEGKTRKELIVERYYSPDPGPYPQDATPLNSVRFTPVQVRAILSGVQPGLTTIVGPPGTGKTDTAVQMIHLLYHNFPSEHILIITHSNQALNDLFMKITERDVPSRHLLRLGMGEAELNTEEAYSRAGRVNAMLTRRLELLSEVERLARSLDINESVAYTCETAAHFWLLHVLSRWERFVATIEQQDGSGTVEEHFPFKTFFSNTPKPLFEGKDFQADWNRALGCFRHLRLVFQELEEIRPFEVLKSHGDRIKYLLTKQAKIIAMTCTHAAIKRREFLELGFTFDTLLMEEAAQVLDVETVLPLMIQRAKDGQSSLKRVILIGDHHQLPPVVKNGALQKWCHMEQSLFTRLIRLGVPYLQLDAQGRSRPSIAALYNWRYDNLGNLPLVMDSTAFKLANPGFAYEYQLIDVPDFLGRGESEPLAYYYQNLGEAEYLVSVFQYMRLLGYPAEKISILTTYNGQCALLQDVIEKRCASHSIFGRPGAISTVDKYQGQQNDYILLSLVRTRHFGHLRDVRRLVVAMSRARLGLYVFARAGLFANCYELRPTFRHLVARPLQLALVPGEQYGNVSRNVNDEVTAPLFASGVEHMASVVENMGFELANLATH